MKAELATPNPVRDFYDAFMQSRMLSYRIYGSPRIDAAVDMVMPHVRSTSRVLDVGCGIGIAAERLAMRASNGFVWACDLSGNNVWYARRTISLRNLDFFVCDVLEEFSDLQQRINAPLDVIVLLDVIEHLPSGRLGDLFARLAELAAPGSIVALSYPTPAYQRYLREHSPGELQPIDTDISAADLMAAAEAAGFGLSHFRVISIDHADQYAHCILRYGPESSPVVPTGLEGLKGRLRAFANKYFLGRRRRRRYIDEAFREAAGSDGA
jgi:trans-aconitate 2-methyltransferase